MSEIKIKVTSAFLLGGDIVVPGSIVSVDDSVAAGLFFRGKAIDINASNSNDSNAITASSDTFKIEAEIITSGNSTAKVAKKKVRKKTKAR